MRRRTWETIITRLSKKTADSKLIVIIALLAVLLLGTFAFVGFLLYQNNAQNALMTGNTKTNNEQNDESNKENQSKTRADNNYSDYYYIYDYIFPSDSEYITVYDLYGKSKTEVALMRNEIYARHGYIFKTEPFKSYFNSKYWYIPNDHFNENMLSRLEKANKDFIVKYEKRMGWR